MKILFLTTRFLPNPEANGVIVSLIAKSMVEKGHEIYVIAEREEGQKEFEIIDGIKIYRLAPRLERRIRYKKQKHKDNILINSFYEVYKQLRKIKLLLQLPIYPNTAVTRSIKVYRQAEAICKENNIDCVIGVFTVYENIWAIKQIKRKHKNITTLGYYLDPIGERPVPAYFEKFFKKICYRSEIKDFSMMDRAILPSHLKYLYKGKKYNLVRDKIEFLEYPLFDKIDIEEKKHKNLPENKINFVYIGTLFGKFRSPEYLLEVFEKLYSIRRDIKITFIGNSDCMEFISKYEKKHPDMIKWVGRVPFNEVGEYINEADFLVNITNKGTKMLPSKIFQLFSSGKPIINVINDKNEASIPYFESYPLKISIEETEKNIDKDVKEMQRAIKELRGKRISFNELYNIFFKNTPEYSSEFFIQLIKNIKK